eukprot:187421_1
MSTDLADKRTSDEVDTWLTDREHFVPKNFRRFVNNSKERNVIIQTRRVERQREREDLRGGGLHGGQLQNEGDSYTDRLEVVVRAIIRDENQIIAGRMGWFLIFQGFLFTALSLIMNKTLKRQKDTYEFVFILMISILGFLTSGSVLLAFGSSRAAKRKMHRIMELNGKALSPISGLEDNEDMNEGCQCLWVFFPNFFFPVVIGLTWLVLFIIFFTQSPQDL